MSRTFVPFDSLWQMRIDVPYSLLVRDGDYAWSCGQLALDAESNVLAADDLSAQSSIVAGYIQEVLGRGGLQPANLKRLVLYYVPAQDGTDEQLVDSMRSVFRAELGDEVLLDAVPVPHFYYDGIVLEVDAFAGPVKDDVFEWLSVEVSVSELDSVLDDIDPNTILSAHWFAPAGDLSVVSSSLQDRGFVHDAGAVVSSGDQTGTVRGVLLQTSSAGVSRRSILHGDVRATSVTSSGIGWIAARSTRAGDGLVEQTEHIMEVIASLLEAEGVDFINVVKSSALYVGDSSDDDLYANMRVRNRRYAKPGPASTGLPIFGLADPASQLTVDILYSDLH